jgi:cytochrome c oxidase subunit IV
MANHHTYINGTLEKDAGQADHHVLPLSLYYGVFGGLLFLTVITVAISYMNLQSASIYVAMFVALIKASLVVGYFMHLKYDDKLLSFVGVLVIFFVFCFFGLTLADVATRDSVHTEWGNSVYIDEKIDNSSSTDCTNKSNCYGERQHNFISAPSAH